MSKQPSRKQKLIQAIALRKELNRRKRESVAHYRAYDKQQKFHAASVDYSERLLMAGNQTGKTFCGSHEARFHATGIYPDWWDGIRFEHPTVGWVGGDTGETIRDTTQRLLLDRPGKLEGDPHEYRGVIPLGLIVDKPKPAMGTPNLFDHFKIRHVSGGVSYIYFKAYAKGRQKWQGETIDWVWFDEEPPYDVYSEGLTRTNNGQVGQFAWLTFTPLLGMSQVVTKFLHEPSASQVVVNMTIEDVDHYSAEEKAKIVASYPAHEREARAKGVPIMGSGRIFPVPESDIAIDPLNMADVPDWWLQIAGIDFGWDHPTAAARILYDADNDVVYVVAVYRQREATPLMFASSVKRWGDIPFAWPHDGLQHDKGSGLQLKEQYADAGLAMLDERATFEDGSNGVEAGLMDMLDRMQTGRFKVDRTLDVWWEEFRVYHRKNGKVVKLLDDALSATRYALMMIRDAEPVRKRERKRKAKRAGWRSA